jgi:hypothetical protein
VSESPALFFVEISAGIHIVLTGMKRGNDELNASSFQFLRSLKRSLRHRYDFLFSVKRFITVHFKEKSLINISSPLLFKRDS